MFKLFSIEGILCSSALIAPALKKFTCRPSPPIFYFTNRLIFYFLSFISWNFVSSSVPDSTWNRLSLNLPLREIVLRGLPKFPWTHSPPLRVSRILICIRKRICFPTHFTTQNAIQPPCLTLDIHSLFPFFIIYPYISHFTVSHQIRCAFWYALIVAENFIIYDCMLSSSEYIFSKSIQFVFENEILYFLEVGRWKKHTKFMFAGVCWGKSMK